MTTLPPTADEAVGDISPLRFVAATSQPRRDDVLRIRLRLSDQALVVPGQPVELGQAIVRRFRDEEAIELPTTAALVGMRPGDVLSSVPMPRARGRGRHGPETTRSARVVEHGRDGVTRVVAGSGEVVVLAPAAGVVETVLPGRLDIRAHGLAVHGAVAWGRPSAGRIVVAADGPASETPAARIDVAAAGAVLVVGSRMDVEAMSRARAIGVAAIISGGVASRDLRQLAESEIRQQAALHAAAPFGLLAVGGYGRLPIPRHIWELLVAAQGRPAGILPEARILVIGGDPAPLEASMQRPEGTVRIVAGEHRDAEGRLVGLAGQRRWPDGSYAPGGFVEISAPAAGEPERICVPLTLLERLG